MTSHSPWQSRNHAAGERRWERAFIVLPQAMKRIPYWDRLETRCLTSSLTGRPGFLARMWMPGPKATTAISMLSPYFRSIAPTENSTAEWYSGSALLN